MTDRITEDELRTWEPGAKALADATHHDTTVGSISRQVVRLIAEVRRLRKEVQVTEGLYRSAHTKYQRCAAALEFYAKPIHWMGPTEDAEIRNVLVAMKGDDPNGWGPAKEALGK